MNRPLRLVDETGTPKRVHRRRGKKHPFTGSDGRSHTDAVQDAKEAIGRAAEMKAGCLIVYSGGRAGHTHNHARRLLRAALDQLLPLAVESNVTLAKATPVVLTLTTIAVSMRA